MSNHDCETMAVILVRILPTKLSYIYKSVGRRAGRLDGWQTHARPGCPTSQIRDRLSMFYVIKYKIEFVKFDLKGPSQEVSICQVEVKNILVYVEQPPSPQGSEAEPEFSCQKKLKKQKRQKLKSQVSILFNHKLDWTCVSLVFNKNCLGSFQVLWNKNCTTEKNFFLT